MTEPFRTDKPLQQGFDQAISMALSQRNVLVDWQSKLAGNITSVDAVNLAQNMKGALSAFNAISALPGIGAYAQMQYGSPTPAYDIGASFTAMVDAFQAIVTWLEANIPANSITITNGSLVGAFYTPAQTAPLLTLINAAVATVALPK